MLEIQVVEKKEELEAIKSCWYTLAENNAITPFQTPQWNLAWWHHVGSFDTSLTLHILVILQKGQICAIAPLMIKKINNEKIILSLSDPYADYYDILVDNSITDSEVVYAKTLEHLCQGSPNLWNKIELKEVFSRSPLIEYFRTYSAANIGISLVSGSRCPRLEINDEKVFALAINKKEYLIKQRRLNRIGKLVCRHFMSPKEIQKRMPKFIEMHSREWLPRKHKKHTFDDPMVERFYTQSIWTLASQGLLMLTELTLDERPIAYYYGFLYKSVYWGYRLAYEIEFAKNSPGHVMHRLMFQYLKENNFKAFDFMRGAETYKYRYANTEYCNTDVLICRAF